MAYFNIQVGYETDIGGGRENQDDYFIFSKPSHQLLVACMLDGHGREVGKIAANSAKSCLYQYCQDSLDLLVSDPKTWLITAHDKAHQYIKDSFRKELETQGYEIMEDEKGGYLLKRKAHTQSWTCVHGGSSSSIMIILKHHLYIGNVGDSSAIISASVPILSPECINYMGDSSLDPSSQLSLLRGSLVSQYLNTTSMTTTTGTTTMSTSAGISMNNSNTSLSENNNNSNSGKNNDNNSGTHLSIGKNTLLITAEHSPESPYEFYRLREFRPRETDPTQPSLLIIYDSPSHEKSRCNSVFEVDAFDQVHVTNMGKYYKNVRKEWASLVSTPVSARFQDALAFTRSLGDLHLSSYGVTHLPEIHHIDLSQLFYKMNHPHEPIVQTTSTSPSDVLSKGGGGSHDSGDSMHISTTKDGLTGNTLITGGSTRAESTRMQIDHTSHSPQHSFGVKGGETLSEKMDIANTDHHQQQQSQISSSSSSSSNYPSATGGSSNNNNNNNHNNNNNLSTTSTVHTTTTTTATISTNNKSITNPSTSNHNTPKQSTPNTSSRTDFPTPLLCLVLATDGIWDNWQYEDITKFVLDTTCVNAVKSAPNGANRVASSLIKRNAMYAKRNFGTHSDNATGIVIYISENGVIPNGKEFTL